MPESFTCQSPTSMIRNALVTFVELVGPHRKRGVRPRR
jgi:hypothetical protein